MTLPLRSIGFSVLIGFFTACSPFKKAEISIQKTTDDQGLIEVNHERMSVQLFGDYLIHPLKQQVTMNWDEAFLKAMKQDGNKKPELLFASHTFLQPHCTLVVSFYSDTTKVTKKTKDHFEQAGIRVEKAEKEIGKNDYIIQSFDLMDQAIQIELFHIDYFLETDYGTYRFSFWSSDRDRKWLFRESTAVLEKLKLKWS
jgi:hypothetical protein